MRKIVLAPFVFLLSLVQSLRVKLAVLMLPTPAERIGAPEYLGDDMYGDHDEIMGPVRRAARPAPALQAAAPNKLRTFVGFDTFVWTGTDGSNKINTIKPQRDFQPTGMVIDTTTSLTTGIPLCSVVDVKVGDNSQIPDVGTGGAPASMFARDSLGAAVLDFQTCKAGLEIALELAITAAPGGTDTFKALVGMFGRVVKGQ
jgi:hypothetical protein